MPLPDQFEPRQTETGQPTVDELLLPGMMIETNYGTGTYVVHEVTQYDLSRQSRKLAGKIAWSIVCTDPDDVTMKRFYYLNEYVAIDGRIVSLFPNNENEVWIIEGLEYGVEKSGQLRLF